MDRAFLDFVLTRRSARGGGTVVIGIGRLIGTGGAAAAARTRLLLLAGRLGLRRFGLAGGDTQRAADTILLDGRRGIFRHRRPTRTPAGSARRRRVFLDPIARIPGSLSLVPGARIPRRGLARCRFPRGRVSLAGIAPRAFRPGGAFSLTVVPVVRGRLVAAAAIGSALVAIAATAVVAAALVLAVVLVIVVPVAGPAGRLLAVIPVLPLSLVLGERAHDPVVVVGMLEIALRENAITGRGSVATKSQVLLVDLTRVAANSDVGPVAVEGLIAVRRVRTTITPSATTLLVWALSHAKHISCCFEADPVSGSQATFSNRSAGVPSGTGRTALCDHRADSGFGKDQISPSPGEHTILLPHEFQAVFGYLGSA